MKFVKDKISANQKTRERVRLFPLLCSARIRMLCFVIRVDIVVRMGSVCTVSVVIVVSVAIVAIVVFLIVIEVIMIILVMFIRFLLFRAIF